MHISFRLLFLLPSPTGRGAGGEGFKIGDAQGNQLLPLTLNPSPGGRGTCAASVDRSYESPHVAALHAGYLPSKKPST